jgi:hypothetical protein
MNAVFAPFGAFLSFFFDFFAGAPSSSSPPLDLRFFYD